MNKKDAKDRQRVLDHLNHYELVALGIQTGVLDKRFYRDWMGTVFVRDWNAAWEFVWRERWKWNQDQARWEYNSKPFEKMETLAREWSKTAIYIAEQMPYPPPDYDAGPGDEPRPEIIGTAPALAIDA